MLPDLLAILQRYPEAARPAEPPTALGNAGGLSGARFWRYPSDLGLLLARAWPPRGPSRPTLEAVHQWLAEAADLGFLPVPLRALDGQTLQERDGVLWEVVTWLDGEPERSRPPSMERVRAAYTALGAFHRRLATHSSVGPSAGIRARLDEVDRLLGGGLTALKQALARRPRDRASDLAARWLDLAFDLAPKVRASLARVSTILVRRQPCLRDARPEHFLFQGDRVSGLVDFGAMGYDSIAADLARLGPEWLGDDPPLRVLALRAYDTSALQPITEADLHLMRVFEESADLLIGAHWTHWHILKGRTFDDPSAVLRGLEKGVERAIHRANPGARLVALPGASSTAPTSPGS